MARGCPERSKKKLKVKNWKEAAKDRRTWRENTQRVLAPNEDDDDDDERLL
jgi:hypothetical protein